MERASYRVLLIEDDHEDETFVRGALARYGSGRFEVECVGQLADATQRLADAAFGLVILDLSLPDGFGMHCFQEVRAAARDVPIVVLTGFDDDVLGSTLVHLGAQDYLVKRALDGHLLVRCLRHAIERSDIERELVDAREAALQAARAKSDFLSAMSHEIRTPLNSILGMADLLAETGLSPEQEGYVAVSRTAGQALLDLIDGILDLSRVEAGRLELDRVEFDLGALLETTLEILAFPAHKKRLTLAFELARDVPRDRVGDPARLRQVLVNLIGNAIKFTERGEILLSVTRDPESELPDALLFRVRDTGIGIPEDRRSAIFERFSQADGSILRRYGGTGLGLSLCTSLLQLMSGRLWVESAEGRGSCFSFTARLELQPGATRQLPAPPPARGGRVLIAGESATERRILAELLRDRGWTSMQVSSCEATREALAGFSEDPPSYDLVLLDCRMPSEGGFAVVEGLQAPGLRERIAMLLTADHRSGDVTRCQDLGLASWLVKPVKPSGLDELLDDLARGAGRERTSPPVADVPPALGEARLLVADDSEDNRALIEAYLKRTGASVEMAENGKLAIERARSGTFDLILMDMQMPVIDGYAAVRAIRAIEATLGRRTPILALTAYAFPEERQRSFEAGCDGHLTKPIRRAELLRAIAAQLALPAIPVAVDDDVRELVPGFLENRRRDVGALRAALERGDFETVCVLGHRMKGAGRSYGFAALSELGSDLERAGRERETARASTLTGTLESYLERVRVDP